MLGFGQPGLRARMQRRTFIALVGGLAGWPFAARHQQGAFVEGIIAQESPPDAEFSKYPHDGSQ